MTRENSSTAIILITLCTFLTSLAQYFMKIGSDKISDNFISILNIPLIGGLLLYGFGAVLLIIALKYGELSVVYPFLSLSFIWVFLLSIFFLGETIVLINWFGLVLIVVGVSFIGRGVSDE